tara:strand:+ start:958 stop:1305 length:348 start_codon:yes stop_codon:yes gene_type:complete
MKYIFTALMALIITSTAHAEDVKWFVSKQVDKAVGTASPIIQLNDTIRKIKPYGNDNNVINPHIKDWYVNIKLTDGDGNTTGFQQMYSHSIVRFTDANGQTYNITFKRVPVTDAN